MTLVERIVGEAGGYGPTWQTSALVAEVRRRLATAESAALDGDASTAAQAALDVAALALALAERLAARVTP